MSEPKSKIMSFRLSAELEALASAAADAAGDKNSSAWCQRLAVEALSKISESNQNENAERSLKPVSAGYLIKALDNLRQLNLDCFKVSLKDKEQYKEFLNVVIASEEEWETITQSVCKSVLETRLLLANEQHTAVKSSGKQEKASEDRTTAQEISDEYLLFAEEMKNEVAELVGSEREMSVFQNGQAIELGRSAIKNGVPVRPPILDASEQTDARESF